MTVEMTGLFDNYLALIFTFSQLNIFVISLKFFTVMTEVFESFATTKYCVFYLFMFFVLAFFKI